MQTPDKTTIKLEAEIIKSNESIQEDMRTASSFMMFFIMKNAMDTKNRVDRTYDWYKSYWTQIAKNNAVEYNIFMDHFKECRSKIHDLESTGSESLDNLESIESMCSRLESKIKEAQENTVKEK